MKKAKGIEYRTFRKEWRGGWGGTIPRQVRIPDAEWGIDNCHRAYLEKLATGAKSERIINEHGMRMGFTKEIKPLVVQHYELKHEYADGSVHEVNVDTVMEEVLFVNPDVPKDDWNKEWGREIPTRTLYIREWGEDDITARDIKTLEKRFHKECRRLEKIT